MTYGASRRAETAPGRFSGGRAGARVGKGRKTPPRPRKRGQRAGETAFMPLDVAGAGHPSRSRPPVTGLDGLPRQRARRGSPAFQADGGSRVGIPAGAARSEARTRARRGEPLTRQERPNAPGTAGGCRPQAVKHPPADASRRVTPGRAAGGLLRRQTDEACSEHGRRPLLFSAKPCGGSAPMRPVLGLGGGVATGGPSGPRWGPR